MLVAAARRALAEGADRIDLPPWGTALLLTTLLAFVGLMLALRYAIDGVVRTLAMVEHPGATPDQDDDDDDANTTADADADPAKIHLLADEKAPSSPPPPPAPLAVPITASVRGTLRHLRACSGPFAFLRGAGLAMVHMMVGSALAHALLRVVPLPLSPAAATAAQAVAFTAVSLLHAAWTLAVVAAPRHPPSFAVTSARLRTLVPACRQVMAANAVRQLVARGPLVALQFAYSYSSHAERRAPRSACSAMVGGAIALILFLVPFTLYFVFVMLPTDIAVTRVEASLLPASQRSLVPFDRTFGGKIVPGLACLGFADAWRSIDAATRRRVLAVYLKAAFVFLAVTLAFFCIFALELTAILGGRHAVSAHIHKLRAHAG